MWSVESNMTKVLFNIQTCNKQYLFTEGIRSEEPGMTNVLFIIQTSNQEY